MADHAAHRASALEALRHNKDRFFVEDPESPLSHHQRHTFEGLQYFPENAAMVVEAGLEPPGEHAHLRLQTTTGQEQEFHRAGRIHFEVDSHPATLTLFGSHDSEGLFLPFRD